jgi:hypothetical protein
MTPICPVGLAYKLEKFRNQNGIAAEELRMYPHRREGMFFLQEMSRRPGGLEGVADRMVSTDPDAFRIQAMQQIGQPSGGRYDLGQCLAVWKALERGRSGEVLVRYSWVSRRAARDIRDAHRTWMGAYLPDDLQHPGTELESIWGWLKYHIDDKINEGGVAEDRLYAQADIAEGVKSYNLDFLTRLCEAAARLGLPDILRSFCEHPDVHCIHGEWFCPDIETALERFMDRHAEQIASTVAHTALMRRVSDEIDNAETTRLPIVLSEEAGVGKSTIARALCEMWPGLRRFFEPKPGSDLRTLQGSIAETLGIDPRKKWKDLADTIHDVLRESGILLVCDEADRLIPASFNQRSEPRRLNWLRCYVIDPKHGCVMLTADDAFNDELARFQRVTNYHDAQWRSRVTSVSLPEVDPIVWTTERRN